MSIEKLKQEDLYSLSMFMLYKLTDIPEFSIVGELPYILDRKNLLNFCNYFGGQYIKVPTVDELYTLMSVIKLYDYVDIKGQDFDSSIKKIGFNSVEIKNITKVYNSLKNILSKYKFGRD